MVSANPLVRTSLSTTLGLQSLALTGRAMKMTPKKFGKPSKKPTKKIIKGFTEIMVGTSMLTPTANIMASVP